MHAWGCGFELHKRDKNITMENIRAANNNNNNNEIIIKSANKWRKTILLLINGFILSIGNCGGPLMTRLYFVRGGTRTWFSSSLLTAAWPLTLLPLAASYFLRLRSEGPAARLFFMTPKILAATAAVGAVNGLDSFLYASGVSKLPISTSALLIATQLAFTACFAFLLVKQRFTPYSVNAIVLLTMGAGVLAFGASSDRPAGESAREYVVGFIMTILAASLYGFLLPAIELVYKQAKQGITYTLVLEIQVVICFSATVFCAIGMIINKDFQALSREARELFKTGEGNYCVVVIWTAVMWQFFFVGAVGVICYGSSLLSGVLIAMLLSVTEVLGVIFFGEQFRAQKGVSLALSLWGFVSYFYGEVKSSKNVLTDPANAVKDCQTAEEAIC